MRRHGSRMTRRSAMASSPAGLERVCAARRKLQRGRHGAAGVHSRSICAATTAHRIRVMIDRLTPGNVCKQITIARLGLRRHISSQCPACCGCAAAWKPATCLHGPHRRTHPPPVSGRPHSRPPRDRSRRYPLRPKSALHRPPSRPQTRQRRQRQPPRSAPGRRQSLQLQHRVSQT